MSKIGNIFAGLGQWNPTSKEWMEVHEETAAKRCKKSSTVSRETREKDKTTAKKSSGRKKCSSAIREGKEMESTIAQKASAGKKSIVNRKAKFETQKKSEVTKPAKTQNKVTKKLDMTTAKVLLRGDKSKVKKHTNVESQELKKNDVTIVRRSSSRNKSTLAKET